MENETPQASPSRSNVVPIAITIAVVVIILAGFVMFATNNQNKQVNSVTPTQTQTTQVSPTQAVMAGKYRNGQYKAVGEYTSPGGAESIDVTLILQDDVVTDAIVVSNATRPTSKQMQTAFIGGFKEQVIGKKIDEINLTKVAKSSLAPKGFNDAVNKIKTQAQS